MSLRQAQNEKQLALQIAGSETQALLARQIKLEDSSLRG